MPVLALLLLALIGVELGLSGMGWTRGVLVAAQSEAWSIQGNGVTVTHCVRLTQSHSSTVTLSHSHVGVT